MFSPRINIFSANNPHGMQQLTDYLQHFEAYRQAHPITYRPAELYEPVNYILDLGGKRLRPVICLMACHLFRDDYQAALPLAEAVETFHNFTLVHDDIMDDAPLRRAHATVHAKWDVNTGILSGDVMLILAYESLLRLPDAVVPPVTRVFNRVAREVCEGQQMDVNFERRSDVTIPEYLKMIELKTAVLIAGAMEMAAIVADARQEDVQNIYEFGRKMGIAFQLQDDILDCFGDPAKFGKKVGGDIVQNKKTYLILEALNRASGPDRERLTFLMNTPTRDESAKIREVQDLLRRTGMPEAALQKRDEFRAEAYAHLESLQAAPERIAALKAVSDQLVEREK